MAKHEDLNMKQLHVLSYILFALAFKHVSSCFDSESLGHMPRDSNLLMGANHTLNCTLKRTEYEGKFINCSNLAIRINNTRLKTKCIDENTIEADITNGSDKNSGTYYCYLSIPEEPKEILVCTTGVYFGYPPTNVTDFKCISRGLKALNCTWNIPNNKIQTTYHLYEKKYGHILIPCPFETGTSCEWNTKSSPSLNVRQAMFQFSIFGDNPLGREKEFKMGTYNHYSIVIPDPPEDFKVVHVGTSNVAVVWTVPQFMGFFPPGFIYQIQYISQFETDYKEGLRVLLNTTLRDTKLGGEIVGLLSNAKYEVRIRCRSPEAVGDDMWSKFTSLIVLTKPKLPEAPTISPQAFEIVNSGNARSVTLYWQNVHEKYWNGNNFTYRITVLKLTDPSDIDGDIVDFVDTVFITHTFASLDLRSAYKFIIQSKNEVGYSVNKTSLIVNRFDQIPASPTILTALYTKYGVYNLSWEYPDEEDSNLDGFTLFWCQNAVSCTGPLDQTTVANNVRSHQLQLNQQNYQFSITANSANSSSSGMLRFPCIVPVDKPLKIFPSFKMESKDSTKLKLSWKLECNGQNSVVKEYIFNYCTANCLLKRCESSIKNITVENSEKGLEEFELVNLKPDTSYAVFISTISKNGEMSQESEMVCKRTAPVGTDLVLIVGMTIGGSFGLLVLVIVLTMIVRWNNKRIEALKNFKVQLPIGLESPLSNPMNSYDNFKNGSIQRNSSPKPAYGRLDSYISDDGFKNRHGSGTSQYSAASTDELIEKPAQLGSSSTEKTSSRNPSGDSSGCSSGGGHDSLSSSLTHRTNLSSDSGNEADLNNPPSPDIDREEPVLSASGQNKNGYPSNESRMSGSKDSGLDKGDDWDFRHKNALQPYTKISGYFGASAPQPYSKLGLSQSCYVPFSRGSRNMAMFGLNMANSEPNIPEMPDESSRSEADPALPLSPSNLQDAEAVLPYSKIGLARSIQDIAGYSGTGNRPANLNLDNQEELVLPYSRFAMLRLPSPTSKNNPHLTVGMAFTGNHCPNPNALINSKFDPLIMMKKSKIADKKPTKHPGNGYILIEDLKKPLISGELSKDVAPSTTNNAYSKLGLGDLSSPVQSPQSKPSSSGYVSLDDIKLLSKSSAGEPPDCLNDSGIPDSSTESVNELDAPPYLVLAAAPTDFHKNELPSNSSSSDGYVSHANVQAKIKSNPPTLQSSCNETQIPLKRSVGYVTIGHSSKNSDPPIENV